jgi:hypothetical protein
MNMVKRYNPYSDIDISARLIEDEYGVAIHVIDYDALKLKYKTLLASYDDCYLEECRACTAELKAALREIADFAEQFIGDDERMYKVHQIADNAIPYTAETACESPWVITKKQAIEPTHEAADAFWKYWRENGDTHKHGYYESTWGAINAALNASAPKTGAKDG